MTLLAEALELYQTGHCPVRATMDGEKRPVGGWKKYQSVRPTEDQIIEWFGNGYHGIGIITGAISGNAEVLEFEGRAVAEGLLARWAEIMDASGLGELRERLRGWVERSPSGGYHIHYRVEGRPVPGNTKLARRPATPEELAENADEDIKTLIETRGEGGFIITAPSNGTTHPSGQPWIRVNGGPAQEPVISGDELEALHDICKMLDQMPRPEPQDPPRNSQGYVDNRLRPGDDFNAQAEWKDVLANWTYCYTDADGTSYWRRPGKPRGSSATTGRNDGDNLYVFSSSTPFDTEKPYSKFAAYTLLNHNGDYSAAAKQLRAQGYGADEPGPTVLHIPEHDDFWDARAELIHIRDFARARRVGPWALLGITLARVIAHTPPFVVLPAFVGGNASLNLFVGIVGASGAGKGGAESASIDVLDTHIHTETFTIGSGEAIAHAYMERKYNKETKEKELHQHNERAIFSVGEIDTLAAMNARQASTTMPELRKAWMGERLGFHYVDKDKRLPVPAHQYRLCLIAGIQPERSRVLLEDADGGTPQRFIWMPAGDPDAPDVTPDESTPWRWALPKWPIASAGRVTLTVCALARDTIDSARLARLRGQGDALDGHALLCQLKVAAALAVLAQRAQITEDDWSLAGTVMEVSATVRQAVVTTLTSADAERNKARGKAEADRAEMVGERLDESAIKKVMRAILRRLDVVDDEGEAEGRLRVNAIAPQDRTHFADAVSRLLENGLIEVEQTSRSSLYRRRRK
jgi:hypothetical protein